MLQEVVDEYNLSNCFRPLSGSYISQLSVLNLKIFARMFPSPIGELHFSIVLFRVTAYGSIVSVPYRGATFLNGNNNPISMLPFVFPSPIGELHFSMSHLEAKLEAAGFPSPIGELHFSIRDIIHIKNLNHVSVPYRGATFLNWYSTITDRENLCFRPLSGSYISQSVFLQDV